MVIIAEIYFSTTDRKQVYRSPTLPPEFPDLQQNSKNEEFATFNNGDFNLLNGAGLRSFSLGYTLPMKQYSFCKCEYQNTFGIINLMLTSMQEKTPIRMLFKTNEFDAINLVVTVERFNYKYDAMEDIVFEADFKEYRVIK